MPHRFGPEFCSVELERGKVHLWMLAFLAAGDLAWSSRRSGAFVDTR